MDELEFTKKIEYIIAMLKERGYNPYEQLACYVLLQGNQYYITSHGDARSLIKELDIEKIRQYLNRNYTDWNRIIRDEKY